MVGFMGHRSRRTPILLRAAQQSHNEVVLFVFLKSKDEFWDSLLWSDGTKLELIRHMNVAYFW